MTGRRTFSTDMPFRAITSAGDLSGIVPVADDPKSPDLFFGPAGKLVRAAPLVLLTSLFFFAGSLSSTGGDGVALCMLRQSRDVLADRAAFVTRYSGVGRSAKQAVQWNDKNHSQYNTREAWALAVANYAEMAPPFYSPVSRAREAHLITNYTSSRLM